MRIIFIRHGKTYGNELKRYIGATNEPLSDEGIRQIKQRTYPAAERVIASPMKRCVQSAQLIYGEGAELYADLRECDFGSFENKSYAELKDEPYYIKWLESDGTISFPCGESKERFSRRCCACFRDIIINNTADTIAFVVHGGTIMAVMERYCGGSFYDYQLKNGDFYICECSIEYNEPRLRETLIKCN